MSIIFTFNYIIDNQQIIRFSIDNQHTARQSCCRHRGRGVRNQGNAIKGLIK